MPHTKIRLACRMVIDSTATGAWERYIYEDTYKEYLMQQQLYNNKENPSTTFRELLAENSKAEKLHYLTGIAAHNYIQQLKGQFYKVADVLGNNFFPFEGYRVDIVNTDITTITKHKIGITFYSPMLTYLGVVNNCYLVSANVSQNTGYETIMFPVQPGLSICYFEEGIINDLTSS